MVSLNNVQGLIIEQSTSNKKITLLNREVLIETELYDSDPL